MTAQILDLASARERLGYLAAARRQESALDQSRRYWLADLDRWPAEVDGRWELSSAIHDMTEADVVLPPFRERFRRFDSSAVNLRERRAAESIPGDVADGLNYFCLHSCVWEFRVRLDFEIWSWGRPERLVAHRLDRVQKAIPAKRAALARLHETLATGLIQSGPRKGERVQSIERTRSHAESRVQEIAALEWELAHVLEWASASPLDYALGRWPQALVTGRSA